MAVEVIDLCSSPEPDESSGKANGALASFLPRKEKIKTHVLSNGNIVPLLRTQQYLPDEKPWLGQDENYIDVDDFDPVNGLNASHTDAQKRLQEDRATSPFRIEKTRTYTHPVGGITAMALQQRLSNDALPHSREQRWPRNILYEETSAPANHAPFHSVPLQPQPSEKIQPANTPILSGAGLEVRRVLEADTNTNGSAFSSNSIRPFKRQASSEWERGDSRGTKKCRANDRSDTHRGRCERSGIGTKLIDVTDPTFERVSWSDEDDPDISLGTGKASNPVHRGGVSTKLRRARADFSKGPNRKGQPYSAEEDELMRQLKEQDGLDWDEISSHFNGRTKISLQVRYSTKLASPSASAAEKSASRKSNLPFLALQSGSSESLATGRGKRARKSAPSVLDGFVPWTSLKQRDKHATSAHCDKDTHDHVPDQSNRSPLAGQDTAFPQTFSQILRNRELGVTCRRAWNSSRVTVSDEVKNSAYSSYALQRQYHGASGDVVALSWAADGDRFAAGSIAISDSSSMQYNMQRNLLVGSRNEGKLQELIEHHIPRPLITEADNVNALDSMRLTQDPRLFKTVTATAFSPQSSKKLFTAGEDKMMRHYAVRFDSIECLFEVPHPARVDLLAISHPHGIVATGCHIASKSVRLYRCQGRDYETSGMFSPTRSKLQSSVPIFPSSLKWGMAPQHCSLLLGGFSGDEEKQYAGETCLWNVEHGGTAIPLRADTRNVFDVAWNPNPSPASIAFAVASEPTSLSVSRGSRSTIQCFAPDQEEARRVLAWECPALDINDVLFCPYDDNLIAAGATDGTVYIWDRRSADRDQKPLHVLRHEKSENVIAHHTTADTGVRFLSWGATKNRLYSGSHDGVVKVWNPYRSPGYSHVADITPPRNERSAIMSGALSPDGQDLLIGTENGRINLFSIAGRAVYRPKKFAVNSAPGTEDRVSGIDAARSMIDSGQIQIRPCGSMPFHQAVQGPNYMGPYLAPSKQEVKQAEKTFDDALIAQEKVHSKADEVNRDDDDDDDHDDDDSQIAQADRNVGTAQQRLVDLEERLQHFRFAEPRAKQFQQSLLEAAKDRAQLLSRMPGPVEWCGLPCAFLPTSDEIEDSGRSELRIPDKLRSVAQNASLVRLGDEEMHSKEKCASCLPMKATRSAMGMKTNKNPALCAPCQLKIDRLTASCSQCAAPARLELDTSRPTLCEQCAFTCFRCDGSVEFDDEMTTVSCPSCESTWEIGALGYEFVGVPERNQLKWYIQRDSEDDHDSIVGDGRNSFGTTSEPDV